MGPIHLYGKMCRISNDFSFEASGPVLLVGGGGGGGEWGGGGGQLISLSDQEKFRTDFQDGVHGDHNGFQQEAHGPPLAHLSEIATADMQNQTLCNIFLIQSLQPMKGSSFEQFLVFKKNVLFFFYYHYFTIYAHDKSMECDHLTKPTMPLSTVGSTWNLVKIGQMISDKKVFNNIMILYIVLVLRFYDPVNPMGSCRAWSVYLTKF